SVINVPPSGGGSRIALRRRDSHAEIVVADNGVGIKAEQLQGLFERFRSQGPASTRRYGGLGLGLAICRHIVELHGGRIGATSAGEGHGAEVTIELPIVTAGARGTRGQTPPVGESNLARRPGAL